MKRNLLLLALAVLVLTSCNHGFNKGNGDLLYKIVVDKDGQKISAGDFISYDMIVKTDADSVLSNSYDAGYPLFNIVPAPQAPGDMNDALTLLTEGDSATFKVDTGAILKNRKKPAYIQGKYLVYNVKVEKVIHKAGLSYEAFNASIINYENEVSTARKSAEPDAIKKYISEQKLIGTTLPSGLFYSITKPGTGDKIKLGDTVELNYTSKFTNGILKATNVKDEAIKEKKYDPAGVYIPFRLIIGQAGTVPGLNEGLQYLNKGAKATFVLPSSIAYPAGRTETLLLLTYTPLVYDVEVLNIYPRHNITKTQ